MRSTHTIAPRRRLRIPRPVQSLSSRRPDPRFLGYLASVSETGAFVQCSNPRPVGSYLCLLLQLPDAPGREIRCAAEIVWTRGYGGALGPSQGMGIRFVEISEDAQRFLRKFCAQTDPLSRAAPRIPRTR